VGTVSKQRSFFLPSGTDQQGKGLHISFASLGQDEKDEPKELAVEMDLGLGVLPGRIQGDIILAKPCGLKVNKHDVVSPWSRKVYLKHGPGIK